MFTYCPLQGALSDANTSQSLLELDGGVKLLINVGWDDKFDVDRLRELENHATISHLGAYAHCCKHLPLFTRIPVYATRPVIDLGRTLTQELYASTPLAATTIPQASLAQVSYSHQTGSLHHKFLLQAPTPQEIARYFSLIQPLKYSQPHQPLPSPFSPPLNGLTVTALNSGHTLGGTIWHIQHGLESIVHAVDWNQGRENVLSGAAWLSGSHGGGGTEVAEQLRKPTALICSSRTPESVLARGRRDEQLLENIKLCIGRGGTVLIPVDSSARVLELAYLLEHAWRAGVGKKEAVFRASKVYLAGRNVSSTMRNARSMLEWMDDSIVREFEAVTGRSGKTNAADGRPDGRAKEVGPFDFQHLRLLERKAQVEYVLAQGGEEHPKGKVMLASDSSLEWGFSQDVLKAIAADARNLVILTERPSAGPGGGSLAGRLWQWWKERSDGVATEQTSGGDTFEQVYTRGQHLDLTEARREALQGDELGIYQQWLATQRQLQATLQSGGVAALEASADVDEASSESSDSDETDTEQQGKALNVMTTMGQTSRKKVVLKDEDLGVTILLKKKGVHDFDTRGKRGRERIFPMAMRRKRNDDYGELIRPEEYLRAEEREEEEGQTVEMRRQEDGMGKKRRWEDGKVTDRPSSRPAKRRQLGRTSSTDEAEAAANLTLADGPGGDELDQLEDDEEVTEGPCKVVMSTRTIQVHVRIALVDFSGRHDRRDLSVLIPLIRPRKLILVGGNEEETVGLATDCRDKLQGEEHTMEVLTPRVGESVDGSVDTNAWVLRLATPLLKNLRWQNVRGLAIVTVTGLVVGCTSEEERRARKRPKLGGGGEKEEEKYDDDDDGGGDTEDEKRGDVAAAPLPVLNLLPTNLAVATRSAAQPIHVGDLRLADLRRAMLQAGHTAEFGGEGTLLVDGAVAVRKTATGRIELDSIALPAPDRGAMGTLYAVRNKIYEGLAVVVGA